MRRCSVGSVSVRFLIMSLGLAVVFGLMGVINMAHGELMMVSAYATFITQELFKAYLPAICSKRIFSSLPVSFLVAGLWPDFGATVIRFLYGRPLWKPCWPWGVSLVLIQLARVYFGDLTAVVAPAWLSGGGQVMVGVYFPYNRLFIIGLSILCVMCMYGLLFRTNLGLQVRAVMQNRNMSSCLGFQRGRSMPILRVRVSLAGLAGCALTCGERRAGLGQNYIVDSFMSGGDWQRRQVGRDDCRRLGIGSLNKFLEPSFGAVYGKVLILVLVILFLRWRPSGLFAIKGRHAD